MVAKQSCYTLKRYDGFNLAKNHMVAKLPIAVLLSGLSFNLAKNHMVAKLLVYLHCIL